MPVVNVEGIKPGELTIDGPTLAKIFLGEIKSWNDAALRRLNPTLKLPAQGIAVVHRSDGSGTTFVFTDYLSKMSADWRSKVGSITSVDWPVGVGARGNEGVAATVGRLRGSIGYVEYAYAKHNKLSSTKLMNKDGNAVTPTIEAFTTAARRANWEGTPGFGVILTNEAGADTWPARPPDIGTHPGEVRYRMAEDGPRLQGRIPATVWGCRYVATSLVLMTPPRPREPAWPRRT